MWKVKKFLVVSKVRVKGDTLKSACAVESTKFDLAIFRLSINPLKDARAAKPITRV